MLTTGERRSVLERAHVLEQVPSYVESITGAEPFLLEDHVAYVDGARLVLVGYALDGAFDADRLDRVLRAAIGRFEPQVVAVAAPVVPASMEAGAHEGHDTYYVLPLVDFEPGPKVRNMVARARRELEVVRDGRFGREHRRLVRGFVRSHALDDGGRFIFDRLPAYAASETVRLYEARDAKGRLVAFDVAEFAARTHAFYAFNVRSRKHEVPGASDLLLDALVQDAIRAGRSHVGLGLGIDEGVTFFKTKWGGVEHLPHVGSRLDVGGATSVQA